MIAYFAKHPTAANLLLLLFLAAGLLSVSGLRRATMPDFSPAALEIRLPYPGATAEEVEEAVCQRIEDALDGVKYVKELCSDAQEGLATITVEMEDEGDFLVFKDDVDSAVGAIDDFPSEVKESTITQPHTTDLVLKLLVSGPMPEPDLKAYCEDLKDRLQELPKVSLVTIRGFSDHQLRIELDEESLRRHGLSAADVASIVRRQSVNLPAGAIETRQRDISIRFVEERRSVIELENLVIVAAPGGAEVRLRDLAKATDTFELDEDKVLLGDRRAGLLQIDITRNQDVIRVADAVKAFVEEERERQPNVEIRLTQDGSTLVVDRLNMLLKNGLQGLLLVFLTMWLFFNFKLSFWVVMSLPVSFLGAFFFMPYFGLSIDMLTLAGMLIALGLLMDDGIVIAENVASTAAKGIPPQEAVVEGVSQVKAGVFASFITTVCVLGPPMFLKGPIGDVLKVVPMVLILVLSVSLVEAFLILPAHLSHSLHGYGPEKAGRFRRSFDRSIDWVRERVVGQSIDMLLRWRYLWIGVVLCVFGVSLGLVAGGFIQFQAFPETNGDVIEARILLPQGTPLGRTEEVVRQVTKGLDRVNKRFAPLQSGGQDLVKTVYVRFNENADADENGPHLATVTADLLTAEQRNVLLDDVFQAWREEVGQPADVVTLVYMEPSLGPAGRNIDIRLQGHNLDRLKVAATEMQAWLSQFEGVFDLADDLRSGKQEVRIRVREGAFGLGLDADKMASQLRAAFYGVTADEIQVGPEPYEIDVRLNHDDQNSLADLEYFHFTLPDGKQVPLSAVAEVEQGRGWARIARVDGKRTVTVRGDADSRLTNTANLIAEFKRSFLPGLLEKYPDINVSCQGEVKESGTTGTSMVWAMFMGLLGIFILLSFQFRSYIEPLIVMAAIPLALIGVIWGHLLMGINMSMPSALGFVSLAGIVVNDSILLVLFLKMRRREGAEVMESAAQASRQRFRAVVLTSLTTIAGLLPLLTERSFQAQLLIPLAVSIAFGLMASTILVLLVIPCLYAILADFGLVAKVEKEEASEG